MLIKIIKIIYIQLILQKKETKLFNILRFAIVKFPQCPRKSELAKNSGNTASRIAELNDVHISGVM